MATIVAVLGPSRSVVWTSPIALFAIVTVAAALCVLAAVAVIGAGHRRDIAEVGLLGTGLFVVSILPLVHGLTAPGVLYGPNEAVRTSVFLSLPGALMAWSPLVARQTAFARWSARHWRLWSASFVGCSTSVAAVLLVWPQVDLAPTSASAWTVAVVAVEVVGTIVLSRQQLTLYEISQRPSALVASLGLVLLAATALVWLGTPPFSAGWWLVHGLDIAGVFGGCVGVYRCHRLERPVTDLLAPVLVLDPLAALAVGLSPAVHRFVAALQHKDPITRDHVVRTAALALRVGQRCGLPGHELRNLGLAALLHDIGKLNTPDALLNKPGRLTPDEYQLVQHHTIDGEAIVRTVPALAPIAPFVRGHHERIDGAGYPDGLTGTSIPFAARIIAVCDAFDAMAHTRQYRHGMGAAKAIAILREHAGSQWDASIVEHVAVLGPDIANADGLESAGTTIACDCADALPDSVRRMLTTAA